MKPVSPVVPGHELPEVVYAKDQPPYKPLPSVRYDDGLVLSRWKMTWLERFRVLLTGNIFLWIHTHNQPLQPVNLQTAVKLDRA